MGLSHTVSEINGGFSRKNFPTPVFCAPSERVSLEIGYRRWDQKKIDGATGPNNMNDDIFSRVDTITNVTDRRTPGDSKDRAYGKNRVAR